MNDASTSGKEVNASAYVPRLHPPRQVPPGMPDRIDQGRKLERKGFLASAPAKIFVYGAGDF